MAVTEKIIGNPFTVPWLIGMIVYWIVRRDDSKNNALFFINLNSESEKIGLMVVLSAIFSLIYWLSSFIIDAYCTKLGPISILIISLLIYSLVIWIVFTILKIYYKKHFDDFGFVDFNNNLLDGIISNDAIYSFWSSSGNLIEYGSIGNADVITPEVGNILLSNENCEVLRSLSSEKRDKILLSTVSAYAINIPSGILIRKHLIEKVNKEIKKQIFNIN